jgi:hypothetical protein
VASRSALRFTSNLAGLVPAECNDGLQVSTPDEKSIMEREVAPQSTRIIFMTTAVLAN